MMARDSAEVVTDAEVVADASGASVTTAAPEAERIEQGLATAPPRWVRPIGDYERRETTVVEGLRYG